MKIKSKFFEQGWSPFYEWEYMCEVTKKSIPSSSRKFHFVGKHLGNKVDFDVAKLSLYKCLLVKIPSGLTEIFPNLCSLRLSKCCVKKISREDLKGMPRLRDLRIEDDFIEELPGDLLIDLWELKALSFKNNKIKFIHPEIFDDLDKLKYFNLNGNSNISMSYNPSMGVSTTMEKIKEEILKKCAPPISNQKPANNSVYSEITFDEHLTYSSEVYERQDSYNPRYSTNLLYEAQEPYNPRFSANLLYPELTAVAPSAPEIDNEYFSDIGLSRNISMNERLNYFEPPPPYDFHERENYAVK